MSRVYGDHWGYQFPRIKCPQCGRDTAYTEDANGMAWMRSHKPCGRIRFSIRDYERCEYAKRTEPL